MPFLIILGNQLLYFGKTISDSKSGVTLSISPPPGTLLRVSFRSLRSSPGNAPRIPRKLTATIFKNILQTPLGTRDAIRNEIFYPSMADLVPFGQQEGRGGGAPHYCSTLGTLLLGIVGALKAFTKPTLVSI